MFIATLLLAALVRVGDHSLHLDCTGRGAPTVVVETGLGETATDWLAVARGVSRSTRVCLYDRAGYGSSAPGPLPRTFDQLNFELATALQAAGEHGPFILVGHSYGGPVVCNFAALYPDKTAGLVLVDATHEDQKVYYGGAYHSLREGAKGREIPPPRLTGSEPSQQDDLRRAEASQTDWSAEYFQRWHDHPQAGLLGSKPLVVLARNSEDLARDDANGSAARERVLLQLSLANLSSDSVVLFVGFDHDMQKSIPDVVAKTIDGVVQAVRHHTPVRERF